MKCKECRGAGLIGEHVDHYVVYSDCWRCDGKGKVTLFNVISYWFWDRVAPVWFIEWWDGIFHSQEAP